MKAPMLLPSDQGSPPGSSSGSLSDSAIIRAAEIPDELVNILLVDDEPKNLTVLETILSDPRYRLVRAESADQALLALVAEEFALIILDIQMPGMTGFELASMVKQRRKTAGVPIIFLTAYYSEDQHVLEGYETGAVDYLHKPVNSNILKSKVAVFAELHRKRRESALANLALVAEINERHRAQVQILELNNELEHRVDERTAELQRTNAALRESDERLRLAQTAGRVGVWEWDLQTGQGMWTDAAWDVLDPADRGGDATFAKWLSCIHPDDRERARAAVDAAKSSGRYQDEFRVVSGGEGEPKWVEVVGAVEYEHATAVRMRGAVRDITDRKEVELELQAAGRRKDEFLAMLGHELRNPLAPIHNAVSILEQIAPHDPDLTWCREVIDRQARQLTRLVDDLLDVSRVTRGKVQIQKTGIDLVEAVRQAVETSSPLIDARRHSLAVRLPEQPLFIVGDFARLSQVVSNLLNNAAKYTNEGGRIELEVHVEPSATSEKSAREQAEGGGSDPRKLAPRPSPVATPSAVICVRDNGRGIEADALENLFEMFYQANGNLDRADGGLGIGLSLVRSLVGMHDGTVEAHSAGSGQGSEFIVRLPCTTHAPQKVSAATTLPAAEKSEGTRILVVDDNRDSAESLGMLLSILGHSVSYAYDGVAAVETALRERPQVLFMDIGLPGQSGYEACRALRRKGFTSPLIVAMTGYGQEEDRRRSHEAGFDHHLVKPVSLSAIQTLLAEHAASLR